MYAIRSYYASLGEIPVEEVHHVVRRHPFGDTGEAGDVAEEDCDLTQLSGLVRRAAPQLVGDRQVGFVQNQTPEGYVAGRVQLAGEPDGAVEADPLPQRLFLVVRRRASLGARQDPDPAGRAFGLAAAGVREVDLRNNFV